MVEIPKQIEFFPLTVFYTSSSDEDGNKTFPLRIPDEENDIVRDVQAKPAKAASTTLAGADVDTKVSVASGIDF